MPSSTLRPRGPCDQTKRTFDCHDGLLSTIPSVEGTNNTGWTHPSAPGQSRRSACRYPLAWTGRSDPCSRGGSGHSERYPATEQRCLRSAPEHIDPRITFADIARLGARMVIARRASGTAAPAGTTSTGRGDRRTTASATEPSHHRLRHVAVCARRRSDRSRRPFMQSVTRRTLFDHHVNGTLHLLLGEARTWRPCRRLCSRSASSVSI